MAYKLLYYKAGGDEFMARKRKQREDIDSQIDDLNMDAADLYGKATRPGQDHSLSRAMSDYDENSGPGGASGIADDPTLGGSTGLADDVGMHVEPGFSVGYDTDSDLDFDGDTGNEIEGGYLTLGDAARGREASEVEGDYETALGVPDAGILTNEGEELSLDALADEEEGGYGDEGTDSDIEGDLAK
jgi:hypothetical protein